jgi:hypothetical protein
VQPRGCDGAVDEDGVVGVEEAGVDDADGE